MKEAIQNSGGNPQHAIASFVAAFWGSEINHTGFASEETTYGIGTDLEHPSHFGRKHAVGKILKLRSDMLFLTLVEAKRRVIILTEQDMCDQCEKEALGGRVPKEIEFVCVPIPDELRTRLVAARLKASGEFSK